MRGAYTNFSVELYSGHEHFYQSEEPIPKLIKMRQQTCHSAVISRHNIKLCHLAVTLSYDIKL